MYRFYLLFVASKTLNMLGFSHLLGVGNCFTGKYSREGNPVKCAIEGLEVSKWCRNKLLLGALIFIVSYSAYPEKGS